MGTNVTIDSIRPATSTIEAIRTNPVRAFGRRNATTADTAHGRYFVYANHVTGGFDVRYRSWADPRGTPAVAVELDVAADEVAAAVARHDGLACC